MTPTFRLLALFCASFAVQFHVAIGQNTAPAPGPSGNSAKVLTEQGVKKLSVFVGTWQAHGNPDSTGKTPPSAVTTCQWSANGQYLVCDQLVTNEGKQTNNLSIYSYKPDDDSYTLSLVGIPGMDPFNVPVTYKGDEFIYSGEYTVEGKKTFTRTLNIFSSATEYIYKVQSSADGINWTTHAEGQSHKVAPGKISQ